MINPQDFALATNAVIPTKDAFQGDTPMPLPEGTYARDFGIGPMDVSAGDLTTQQTITITRDGTPMEPGVYLSVYPQKRARKACQSDSGDNLYDRLCTGSG